MANENPTTNTPKSTKPKKRFTIEKYANGFYVVLDEQNWFWINGRLMGVSYNFGDYCRRHNHFRKTVEEARLDLPSPDEYEILPSETPLVVVRIEKIDDQGREFEVYPDEAVRIQEEISAGNIFVRWESIDGNVGFINVEFIKDIHFRRI